MNDCIFCKIIAGEIPSFKIWENDDFIAFLDINPLVEGMTLVVPKEHYDPNLFHNDSQVQQKLLESANEVSNFLEQKLEAERIILVAEGLEIPHLHVKLYPHYPTNPVSIINMKKEKTDIAEVKRVFEKITSL